jgi:hypothetical protein
MSTNSPLPQVFEIVVSLADHGDSVVVRWARNLNV